MTLSFSPYTLKKKGASSTRHGALFRIAFSNELVGYCDCHPWKELGDLPLEKQMDYLKKGMFTPLTKRSFYFASIDAKARADSKLLVSTEDIPKNHYLLPKLTSEYIEEAKLMGFSYVKTKLNKNRESVEQLLNALKVNTTLKIRIDLNLKWTESEFCDLLTECRSYLHQIDYFEDPFFFHPRKWKIIQNNNPTKLAIDWHSEEDHTFAFTHILKPAIQDETIHRFSNVVVTSYLDHPFGQVCASYVAAQLYRQKLQTTNVCGLMSHLTYETNAFSELFANDGPNFILPSCGTGFGFDNILENLSWRKFCDLDAKILDNIRQPLSV